MSTTVLGMSTYAAAEVPTAAGWNSSLYALDRVARVLAYPNNGGVVSGWQLAAAKSTVTSGAGVIGPFYCQTTASQVISGIVSGAGTLNYIYARADSGSPASGTVDFVARTTSGALLNPDGITYAARIGYLKMNAGAVSGAYNSGSVTFPRSKPWTVNVRNRLVQPGGATGAVTTQALQNALRYSGAALQYQTRTLTLVNGMVTALATTGAWTTVPSV